MIVTESAARRQLRHLLRALPPGAFRPRGMDRLIHLQWPAHWAPIQRLRKAVGVDVAEFFPEGEPPSLDFVVFLEHQFRVFPVRHILEVNAPTWICAVAPDRVIPVRGIIPPELPKPGNLVVPLLRAVFLNYGISAWSRTPHDGSCSGLPFWRTRVRCQLFLDRPRAFQCPQEPCDLWTRLHWRGRRRRVRLRGISLPALRLALRNRLTDDETSDRSQQLRGEPPLLVSIRPPRSGNPLLQIPRAGRLFSMCRCRVCMGLAQVEIHGNPCSVSDMEYTFAGSATS